MVKQSSVGCSCNIMQLSSCLFHVNLKQMLQGPSNSFSPTANNRAPPAVPLRSPLVTWLSEVLNCHVTLLVRDQRISATSMLRNDVSQTCRFDDIIWFVCKIMRMWLKMTNHSKHLLQWLPCVPPHRRSCKSLSGSCPTKLSKTKQGIQRKPSTGVGSNVTG